MAETLDTLAAKIDALGARMDNRFTQVDARFTQVDARFTQVDARFDKIDGRLNQADGRFTQVDGRFDQLESRLGVKIEAVHALAKLAVERLDDVLRKDVGNSAAHARMDTRIDSHDSRILALEGRSQSEPS